MIWRKGYTIIEILVALSIAGILFTSGFASFRDFSRRQILAGTLRSLKGDLRLAQEYSLIGKKPTECNDKSLDGYRFLVSTSNQYVILAECAGIYANVKTVDLAAEVTISLPSPNPIIFKVLGQGTNLSSDATVTLTQTLTGQTGSVTVTKGGEIK